MTLLEAMEEAQRMAKGSGQLCFLYQDHNEYKASFQYRNDWLFKAYPGGRKILSMKGAELVRSNDD